INGGVDTHQVAIHVHQGSARVAGVDGRIGLDEVFKSVNAQLTAAQGADDATGDGLPNAERVADGQNTVPHGQCVGVAQHDHGQFVEFDLENGQVGVGVGADDAC